MKSQGQENSLYNVNAVLQYAVDHDMLDVQYVQDQIEMLKREELLKKHPYKIWQGKDGKWRTYLPDEEKGRNMKKRNTESEIKDLVAEYWKEKLENPTVRELYDEWITDKLKRKEIVKETRDRYNRQFDESLQEFGKRRIKTIAEFDIEDTILNAIYEHDLTAKGYSNLRTLFYGIFKRAKKKKMVDFSITEVIADMDISKKSFRKVIKTDEELIFSEDETDEVINYIMESDLDILNLGILLYFKSGARPGELVALKPEDVMGRVLHIRRTEIFYKGDDGKNVYEVRDFPKTAAGIREVILPSSAEWILKEIRKLNPFGEYLFERNEERIRTYTFTSRLKTICRKLGIVKKSLNKIRKTYGTILLDNGVEESLVIAQMGHTDIKTTKRYYYRNRKSLQQKSEVIDKVSGL